MQAGLSYLLSPKVVLLSLLFLLGSIWPPVVAARTAQAVPRIGLFFPADRKKSVPLPTRLQAVESTCTDLLLSLSRQIVSKYTPQLPYLPWVQAIDLKFHYSPLVWRIVSRVGYCYEGGVDLLLKGVIQLAGEVGYSQYSPTQRISSNLYMYTTQGVYGRIGLDYWSQYTDYSCFYGGLRYGRGHADMVIPALAHTGMPITASWVELILGSEKRIWSPIYAGLVMRLGVLCHATQIAAVPNYVISGYGRTANRVALGVTLFVKYKFSFLKKQYVFR